MLRAYTTRLVLTSSHRNIDSASAAVDRLKQDAHRRGFEVQETHIRGEEAGEKQAPGKVAA